MLTLFSHCWPQLQSRERLRKMVAVLLPSESSIPLHKNPVCIFGMISEDSLSLMETLYSFFLPAHEWKRSVDLRCVLSLTLLLSEGDFQINREAGEAFLPSPPPPGLLGQIHLGQSTFIFLLLKKIMLTEGQFDSLQNNFIPTEQNDLYFSKIFLWVTVCRVDHSALAKQSFQ